MFKSTDFEKHYQGCKVLELGRVVASYTGMAIALTNDGPVTLLIDSKARE